MATELGVLRQRLSRAESELARVKEKARVEIAERERKIEEIRSSILRIPNSGHREREILASGWKCPDDGSKEILRDFGTERDLCEGKGFLPARVLAAWIEAQSDYGTLRVVNWFKTRDGLRIVRAMCPRCGALHGHYASAGVRGLMGPYKPLCAAERWVAGGGSDYLLLDETPLASWEAKIPTDSSG